jgi:hypothetical protein
MAAQERQPRPTYEVPRALIQGFGRDDRSEGPTVAANQATRFWPTMLLVVLCQVADLISFNLAVEMHGAGGELGPLGIVYQLGGFWAVAVVKLGIIAIVLTVLERYPWQRLSTRRNLALFVAGIGIFGAITNVLAFTNLLPM